MLFNEEKNHKVMSKFQKLGFDNGQLEIIEDYMSDNIDSKTLKEKLYGAFSGRSDYLFNNIFYERDESFYKCAYVAYITLGDKFRGSWCIRYMVDELSDIKDISDNTEIPAWELVEAFILMNVPSSYHMEDNFKRLRKVYPMYKEEFNKVIREGNTKQVKALSSFIAVDMDFNDKDQEEIDEIYLNSIKDYLCDEIEKNLSNFQGKAMAEKIIEYITEGKGDITGLVPASNGRRILELPIVIGANLDKIDFCKRAIRVIIHSFGEGIIGEVNTALGVRNRRYDFDCKVDEELINYYGEDPVQLQYFIKWLISQNIDYRSPSSKGLKIIYRLYKDNFMEFFEGADLVEKIYMIIVMKKYRDIDEYSEFIREYAKKEFEMLMDYAELDDKAKNIMIDYMDEKVKFNKLKIPKKNALSRYDRSIFDVILGYLPEAWKSSPEEYNRYINIMAYITINNIGMASHITAGLGAMINSKVEIKKIEELFESCKVEKSVQAAYIASLTGRRYGNTEEETLHAMIKNHGEEVFKGYEMCLGEVKEDLLEEIRDVMKEETQQDKQEKYKEFLFYCMNESGKGVKEEVRESIEEAGLNKELVLRALNDSKVNRRMMAVNISENCMDEEIKKELINIIDKEKSAKVKNRIQEVIGLESQEDEEQVELDGSKVLEEYCIKNTSKNKLSKIKWMSREDMPSIRYKDGGEISQEVYNYLMVTYSDTDGIKLNPEGEKVAAFINEKDLKEMAWVVLNQWINSGAEAKKKWVLIFSTVYGDYRVVDLLKKKIKEWPENSRGTMATYAIKALALNGSDEVLLFLDGISRKFKFKQIKKAAGEALEIAASELNIHPEELSDRLIPTLGFENGKERVFDYGERSFTVSLGTDLSLSVKNSDGKKLKNLPAVGKKDNKEMAEESREEFKLLKKSLKNVVSIQRERLELALSSNRLWTIEKWEKIFVQNDIMHMFAVGLVWGIYKDREIVESFRYMEDGTFNTFDEDELEIDKYRESEAYYVGLAHPVELQEDVIEGWKEQFEDYEIEQPFLQLHREIFSVEESEKEQFYVDRFAGYEMNGLSLLGRVTKLGWYKGSILDAGGYYTFYKEIGDVGVQLYMSGMYVGMGAYDAEDVMIFEYAFYKAGSFDRGSYVYDDITKEIVINPQDVPERVFSEVANDLLKVTEKCEQRDENWKNNENYGYHGLKLK